jgi:hypothetical protein
VWSEAAETLTYRALEARVPSSFIRELNELIEPLPISIQASDPYTPMSKDKPEKARPESFGPMVVDNTYVWATRRLGGMRTAETPKLAVCAELEDETRHQAGAECAGHRVRVGHVREVDVGRAPQRALRALDA